MGFLEIIFLFWERNSFRKEPLCQTQTPTTPWMLTGCCLCQTYVHQRGYSALPMQAESELAISIERLLNQQAAGGERSGPRDPG